MKAEEMPIGAITTRFQVNYEMTDLAQQLIEESLMSVQDLIKDAEIFTEERNGKTMTLEDMTKAMGIYEDDTIKSLEQTLAKAKANKKRYEQEV